MQQIISGWMKTFTKYLANCSADDKLRMWKNSYLHDLSMILFSFSYFHALVFWNSSVSKYLPIKTFLRGVVMSLDCFYIYENDVINIG